jgi:Tfp pilus assembly protein PilW
MGGFSMIELMVAMILGLLVAAGLIDLFVASRQSYLVQSGNNYLQQNLRLAASRIGWTLRMADFWGGNDAATNVTVTSSATDAVTSSGNCTAAWVTAVSPNATGGGGVFGYEGAADSPLGEDCIGGAGNYVSGSDVLVVRYADPQVLAPGPAESSFAPAEASTISGNPKEVFVLSTPNTSAQLFAGTPPSTSAVKVHRYAYPYQLAVYYLRPCNVLPTGGTCNASADGGTPLPTLMRLSLQSDGTLVSDPVVEGIEQFKVEYGVAADMSNVIPTYKSASSMGTTDWARVVAVRVSMVAVNSTRDLKIPHVATYTLGDCTYTINNNEAATTSHCGDFTPYGGNKPWQFVRASQQFVVQLRNRVRE